MRNCLNSNKAAGRRFLQSALALVVSAIIFSSCAKEETGPAAPGPGPSPAKGNFSWTLSGGSTVTADSSVCYLQFTTIYAFKSGTLTTVEINLSDMSSGTYVISSSTGNELKYASGSTNLSAKSGTVYLTNNANGKVSGNFSCAFTSTTAGTMSGQFSDVPIR